MSDFGDVGGTCLTKVAVEVDGSKERMLFDFVDAVATQTRLGYTTQLEDQVGGRIGNVGLLRNSQRCLPVDDLRVDSHI